MDTCVDTYSESPCSLKSRVALWNNRSDVHQQKQAINPFSTDASVSNLEKRRFTKEEYGRPVKGSKSEMRALRANLNIWREVLTVADVIDKYGEALYQPREKQNDPRKVIRFGYLFDIYTTISDKLVGMLLRARKQKIVDFEGEMLFQKRDDHVPIFLIKPFAQVKQELGVKIGEIEAEIRSSDPMEDFLGELQEQQQQQQ